MREPAFATMLKSENYNPNGVPYAMQSWDSRLGPLAAAGDRGFRSPSPA